jgi:hypothetical protein
MVTIGSIWSGTFRFVRDNIGPILIWSVLVVLMSVGSSLVMAPFYQQRLAEMQAGTPPSPHIGAMFLPSVFWLAILTMLWAAAFRAVFFPGERRFAYLRLGMDELRLLGTALVLFVGGYLAAIIVGALLAVIGYAIAGAVPAVILGLIVVCAAVWAAIRVSPAGALTILERKVVIGGAWRLTRGAFWRLFGAYMLLTIAFIVVYGVIFTAQMGPILSDMAHPTDPEAAARVAQWQMSRAHFSIRMIVTALVTGLLGGFSFAFQAGMIGVATDQLLGRRGGEHLSEVFE